MSEIENDSIGQIVQDLIKAQSDAAKKADWHAVIELAKLRLLIHGRQTIGHDQNTYRKFELDRGVK